MTDRFIAPATRPASEIRAEIARWKAHVQQSRFLRSVAASKSERSERSIEAAYSAIIIGALAFALGDAPSPTTRIELK